MRIWLSHLGIGLVFGLGGGIGAWVSTGRPIAGLMPILVCLLTSGLIYPARRLWQLVARAIKS